MYNVFQEQMQDVLDAMFEKTVQTGEYVIKQGDDGDNFYVIERWGLILLDRFSKLFWLRIFFLCITIVSPCLFASFNLYCWETVLIQFPVGETFSISVWDWLILTFCSLVFGHSIIEVQVRSHQLVCLLLIFITEKWE